MCQKKLSFIKKDTYIFHHSSHYFHLYFFPTSLCHLHLLLLHRDARLLIEAAFIRKVMQRTIDILRKSKVESSRTTKKKPPALKEDEAESSCTIRKKPFILIENETESSSF